MSYFSHGFCKVFIGTLPSQGPSATTTEVDNGLVIESGISTNALKNTGTPNTLGLGSYMFASASTYLSVVATDPEVTTGQPLVLASAAIPQNDKIGQFHGGYQESNKSKIINPKYVNRFYKFEDAIPEQAICHVGNTNWQTGFGLLFTAPCGDGYTDGTYTNVPTTTSGSGTGLTVDVVVQGGEIISMVENNVGDGNYVIGDLITPDPVTLGHDGVGTECTTTEVSSVGEQNCEFEFLCGETYNLQINLSGSPVLRYLNRDSYRTLAAYTGCCPEGTITPIAVDSTLVMIDWANQIIESPYFKDFIRPIVYTEAGLPLFATADEAIAAGYTANDVWTNYTSTGHTPGALAGLRLIGAYVDTEFSTCTFQCSDYWNKEIVQMDLSLVDENGDPCTFEGLCIDCECCGFGGQGFGDTYLKELILSESYLQNKFSADPRIREITEGNALRDALVRTDFYTRYVIQHTVPRPYNPSSIYDADQYNLVIIVPSGVTATDLEAFMEAWLTAAGNPIGPDITNNGVETFGHTVCPVTPV